MRILIDTANIDKIREAYDYLPISGVTCNPSILKKENRDPIPVLKEIRSFLGEEDLFIQTVGETAEEMIEDGKAIAEAFGSHVYIKVPSTREGFKAMKRLKEEGYRLTATAIYYPQQALIAGNIGVDYIAPYYNRIETEGMDAVETIRQMQILLKNTPTKILGASFHTIEQVLSFSLLDPEAITLAPAILDQLSDLEIIEKVAEKFNADFYELVGSKSCMKDVL